MKIALYSDLHRETKEWEPPTLADDVEVVILAGDIGSHTHGLDWAAAAFPGKQVIYVAGNHEYYGAHLGMLDELRKSRGDHCHFLEKQTFEYKGVRFLGCTLWSGFDLYGQDGIKNAMSTAWYSINDYWSIFGSGGKLIDPIDTRNLFKKATAWLDEELSKPFDGKTVVVTHFAPHKNCIDQKHAGAALTPFFVSDLSLLIKKHKINVWCYGHTHSSLRFIDEESACFITSNQLGYPRERSGIVFDTGFENNYTFEV